MKLGILLLFSVALVGARKGFGPGDQEWGFAEVRPGANMFWWVYRATEVTSGEIPLLIWLQGGPGASSTGYGNFMEIGPLDADLKERESAWNRRHHVMFIDNPVGTGYSWVEKDSLLTKNNAQIASDLVECLKQALKGLPEDIASSPIHILSESYGGKMAAEFALELDKAIKKGDIQAKLVSVGLGDSWISPIDSVLTWGPYLLSMGLVDPIGMTKVNAAAERTRMAVKEGRWDDATNEWGRTEGVVLQVTDGIDFYNVLTKIESFGERQHPFKPILPGTKAKATRSLDNIMNVQVKEALGLPSQLRWSESSGRVFSALNGDFMKPVTDVVERLLNETTIKVVVYTGQLDLIVDTPGTIEWVWRLKWADRKAWLASPRYSLSTKGYVEGYYKTHGTFSVYWVDRAGHMVPADNPAGMDAILDYMTGQPAK